MNVRESYSRALEQGTLTSSSMQPRQHSYFPPVTSLTTTVHEWLPSLAIMLASLALSVVVGEIERNGSTDVEINYSSLKVRCQFRAREKRGKWRAITMVVQCIPLIRPADIRPSWIYDQFSSGLN